MYHVPLATILAVGTRFLSTTNQYFSTNFFLVESNRIHFSHYSVSAYMPHYHYTIYMAYYIILAQMALIAYFSASV